ncbi:toxic anion resistance protein [Klebsiella phage Muenster]|nr:toxic anion resistance protein [Klebsiella phage Muenster]
MSEKEINPTKATKKTNTKTRKALAMDDSILETPKKNLPSNVALRDTKGTQLALTIENINSIGTVTGTKVAALSNDILTKVNASDTSTEFGKSVSTILNLTRSVDIESLVQDKSLIGWLRSKFVDVKQKVGDQYKNSKEQIDEILTTMERGIIRQQGEQTWLENSYNESKNYLFELRDSLDNLLEVTAEQQSILAEYQKDENVDVYVIQDQKAIVDALERQVDTVRRLILMVEINIPQIAAMKKVNLSTISKFHDMKTIMIPSWTTTLSQNLISDRQKKDQELTELLANETNRMLRVGSEMVGKNMIAAAKAAGRGVVDVETLRIAQKNIVDGMTQVIHEEKKLKEERANAAIEMSKMSLELKETLRDIAEKSGKI